MKDRMERYVECIVRAVDEQGLAVIEGTPIVYDSIGNPYPYDPEGFEEVIRKGALEGADISDVVLTVNHDGSKVPLARTRNGKGTMTLVRQPDGLHFRAILDTVENATAKEVFSALKRGDLWGMSFIAIVNPEDIIWSEVDGRPHAEIARIAELKEISIVTRPAYKDTRVKTRSEAEALTGLAEAKKAKAELELAKARNIVRSRI